MSKVRFTVRLTILYHLRKSLVVAREGEKNLPHVLLCHKALKLIDRPYRIVYEALVGVVVENSEHAVAEAALLLHTLEEPHGRGAAAYDYDAGVVEAASTVSLDKHAGDKAEQRLYGHHKPVVEHVGTSGHRRDAEEGYERKKKQRVGNDSKECGTHHILNTYGTVFVPPAYSPGHSGHEADAHQQPEFAQLASRLLNLGEDRDCDPEQQKHNHKVSQREQRLEILPSP